MNLGLQLGPGRDSLHKQCACGVHFVSEQGLRWHKKSCPVVREQAARAFKEAEENKARRKRQRLNTDKVGDIVSVESEYHSRNIHTQCRTQENEGVHFEIPSGTVTESNPPGAGGEVHHEPIVRCSSFACQERSTDFTYLKQTDSANAGVPVAQSSEPHQPRARRRQMLSKRVLNMLPGRARNSHFGSGTGGSGLTTELLSALYACTQTVADSGAQPDSAPAPEPSQTPSPLAGGPDLERAQRSRFTTFCSHVNKFRLFKVFRHCPSTTVPNELKHDPGHRCSWHSLRNP